MYYYGLADWKKKNNYHRRSLAKVMMFRFKQLLRANMIAHIAERQAKEIGIKCAVINKMTALEMLIRKVYVFVWLSINTCP
jgi:hypothetical protein